MKRIENDGLVQRRNVVGFFNVLKFQNVFNKKCFIAVFYSLMFKEIVPYLR